jgi:hypothetical protein
LVEAAEEVIMLRMAVIEQVMEVQAVVEVLLMALEVQELLVKEIMVVMAEAQKEAAVEVLEQQEVQLTLDRDLAHILLGG